MKPFSHCHFCGTSYGEIDEKLWPRTCKNCNNTAYRNPLPVAVAIVPVRRADGILSVLAVKRGIPPKVGELALPGGFVEAFESWQEGCVRELFEETGVRVDSQEVTLFDAASTERGQLLIFGVLPELTEEQVGVDRFVATPETQGLALLDHAVELAFPLHTNALAKYAARCLS